MTLESHNTHYNRANRAVLWQNGKL